MALLVFLKREGFGSYSNVDEFVGELARRSTSALGGFGAVLSSKNPDDVKEAAAGDGQNVCTDLVRDLRAPKGARVAALRALMLAGGGANLPKVFAGAADLLGDARLPEADRIYLGKTGLQRFVEAMEPLKVSLEVARGAAAAAEAARVLGADAVKEVLAKFPDNHTTVLTMRHAALGEPLAEELRLRWHDVLARQFKAAKNAPPAARRLGTAPEWPPVVPEVFRPLLAEAEKGPPASVPMPAPSPAAASGAAGRLQRSLDPARSVSEAQSTEYLPPAKRVTAEALRSGPKLRAIPVEQLRFGRHLELVATRGVRATERLLAAFDVAVNQLGIEKALGELRRAAEARGRQNFNEPMLDELYALAADPKCVRGWRRAIEALLEVLSPDRYAALPERPDAGALRARPPA